MNNANEFDDLARRKLDERAFAFNEAHWLEAERLIKAERDRKRAGFIRFAAGAALLALLGAGAWWWSTTGDRGSIATSAKTAALSRGTSDPRTASGKEASITPEQQPSTASPQDKASIGTEQGASSSASAQQPATPRSSTNDAAMVRSGKDGSRAPKNDRAMNSHLPVVSVEVTASTSTKDKPSETNAVQSGSNGDLGAVKGSSDVKTNVATTPAGDTGTNAVTPWVGTTSSEPDPLAVSSGVGEEPINANPPDSTPVNGSNAIPPAPLTNDSATATLPAAPEPALIKPNSPWEVSLLGGVFSSTSHYSGGSSDAWSGDISRGTTPGFGGEVMHMGRNFGVGLGLHYNTYAERIRTAEIYNSTTQYTTAYFLMTIDTTVLVINDSTPGTPTVYTGQSVLTSITVLGSITDSSVTTTRTREARDQVNTVSYVEIPLLLDAHLVQGRWSLGLRGGPTIGLLSGRRGALPNGTQDGYTDLNDEPFNSTVFGYMGRAYIRYRFNSAWSVGLEPSVHGQLADALNGAAYSRRSSAFGAMVSLSYRLR